MKHQIQVNDFKKAQALKDKVKIGNYFIFSTAQDRNSGRLARLLVQEDKA